MNLELLSEEYGIEAKAQALLSDYTTFRLGGPCRAMIICQKAAELETLAAALREQGEGFIVIGEGSNLLVADRGIDALVVRFLSPEAEISAEEDGIRVGGGTLLSDLCTHAIGAHYANFTYCVGIPGTVGGALVGNAGAFGRQLGDELIEATVLDFDGRVKTLDADEMEFAYRDSVLKHSQAILLSALFAVEPGALDDIRAEAAEYMTIRKQRHPDYRAIPTAGSFFRNIEPSSAAERRQAAGWFLEQSGALDMSVGGAGVFERHANIIVKQSPECSSADVVQLAANMQAAVLDKFKIRLQREVTLLGDWDEAEESE
jgi:UDP-N-acetylmuramate dehydrogenase